ncbi:hypothetical protein SLEP1_g41108 [Rubroshorea leprosula]|uniref:Uncharacterized protein n=1 Tax=Rubroshorea leprosula TaxID=152421 RepID=A0AAV5L5U9_9ROSI|nr:hypothetical protein SLEP1_g41108 [Rubroshorea leprosula]
MKDLMILTGISLFSGIEHDWNEMGISLFSGIEHAYSELTELF